MQLWSIQNRDFIDQAGPIIKADWSKLTCLDYFEKPYKWMLSKMHEHGIKAESMIWAWYQWSISQKKPDLNGFHTTPGSLMYCLELEVPDDLVLLSCFDGWHCVLNNWYMSLSEDEDNAMLDATDEQKQLSWDRIFDLNLRRHENWFGEVRAIQAVIPYIDRKWIKKVEPFIQCNST